jgi:tetratricopeptide (TPR) repeat protein
VIVIVFVLVLAIVLVVVAAVAIRARKPAIYTGQRSLVTGDRSPIASGLLLSLGSLLATVLLVLLAELAARVLMPEACGKVQQEAERVAAARRYLAPCFENEPPRRRPGVARIVVVGESSGDLLAKHLERLAAAPGCGAFEVLNCAQPGSALEHVARRFEEVLDYQPDAVVLVFGHNIHFQFEMDESKLRLQSLRTRSCLVSRFAAEPPPSGSAPLDARLVALERFLRGAAAKARDRKVELVVSTMASNLWLPPGSGSRDENEPRLLEARFLEARGRTDDSVRQLEALVAQRDFALWHFEIGVLLARAGEARRAYEEMHRALDDDGLRLRAPDGVNDLLRRVAADENLPLRDTVRVLESSAPGGMPGWESFSDNCHLLPSALDREAAAIVSMLPEGASLPSGCRVQQSESLHKLRDVLDGVADFVATWPPDVARVWYRGIALAVESWVGRERNGADREVKAFLDAASFADRPDEVKALLLVAVAEGYERAGRHARALALNELARSAGGATPWVQKGVFHLRHGEDGEARQAFEQALALESERRDARAFLEAMSKEG